jgi:putative ABC transport system permease protein
MIGLALITFVAILGAGLRSSFGDAVNKLFVADYALTAENGFDPFTKEADAVVAGTPGVTAVSGLRAGDARIFGHNTQITAVPPNTAQTIRIDWLRGGTSVPARLGTDGAFVAEDYAKDHHLRIGSPIAVKTPTGKVLRLRLKGIFDPPKGGSPFGDVTMSAATFDANYAKPQNLMTLINIKGGVNDANTARLNLSLHSYPDAKIMTASEFKKNQEADINLTLNLLYGLLGLSVIISLFGVVNTLVLSVFERTRELGMLRAVGMTRHQVSRMVRQESVITALIGAALGLPLGVFLAVLVTRALSQFNVEFVPPWKNLIGFAIVAMIAGVLAAVAPARRASRLNVLRALQYE